MIGSEHSNVKLRSARSIAACFVECKVFVEMLNGFPPRIAENEVLGFNDVQCVYRLCARGLYSAMGLHTFCYRPECATDCPSSNVFCSCTTALCFV